MTDTYRRSGKEEQTGNEPPETEYFQGDIQNANECEDPGQRLDPRIFKCVIDLDGSH